MVREIMKTERDDLNKLVTSFLNYFTKYVKEYGKIIGLGLILGTLVYLPLMSRNLVNNFDGIWHPSYFIAGDWEISLGRGLQRYADRARFGLVTSSFNSFIVIALIAIGDSMIIKRLQIRNVFMQTLFMFLSIANPVVCESLTYSYMSVNFALAYLFSVMAFYAISSMKIEKYYLNVIFASIFFALSMGFYQSYIGVTLVLIIVYLIRFADKGFNNKQFFRKFIDTILVLLFGGLIYVAITKVLCYKAGVSLSGYKGADNVSFIKIIANLPQSLLFCYRQFYDYIFTNGMSINLEFCHYMIILLSIIEIAVVLCTLISISRHNKMRAVISAVVFILLPIASCFVCVIAVGNEIRGLMATGIIYAVIVPIIAFAEKKLTTILSAFMLVIISFYLVSAVQRDQIALHEGKVATTTLTQGIFYQIHENGYMEQADSIAFVGRAADNPTFRKSFTYESANEYAQFGKWSTEARNNRVTWEGVINEFCGLNVNMCGDDMYKQIIATDVVENMPVYPGKGSMTVINNVLVIKVSNNY